MSIQVLTINPANQTGTPADVKGKVATALPEKLKLPEKGSVLSLVPALKETADNLEAHATTASQSLAKLEEILQAVKNIETQANPALNAAAATIKVQLPEHRNTAEVNCGVLETDPVVTVTYSPGRSFIPFVQRECPTTLSATLKSFNGKRDVKFSDLVLTDNGRLEIAPDRATDFLKGVASWIKGITSVIHQDVELRTKRLGYDGGNEHFESQLLDAVVQILRAPALEFIYQEHESEETSEARKKREALIEGARQVTLEALENVRRQISDVATTVDSLDVDAMRAEYLVKLEEKFDAACKEVKPEALKLAEERLAKINEEIAQKEAKLKPSPVIDRVQLTATLFSFLDGAVRSHSMASLGTGQSIKAQNKMEWARQLCSALEKPNQGIGYNEVTNLLQRILWTACMYHKIDGTEYVKWADIDKSVKITIRTVKALDGKQVASVLQILDKMKESKTKVYIDDIGNTLANLCDAKTAA